MHRMWGTTCFLTTTYSVTVLQYCVLIFLSGRFQSIKTLPLRKSLVVLWFLSWLVVIFICCVHLVLLLWLYLVSRVLNKLVSKYISEELNLCYFIIIVCFVVDMIRYFTAIQIPELGVCMLSLYTFVLPRGRFVVCEIWGSSSVLVKIPVSWLVTPWGFFTGTNVSEESAASFVRVA